LLGALRAVVLVLSLFAWCVALGTLWGARLLATRRGAARTILSTTGPARTLGSRTGGTNASAHTSLTSNAAEKTSLRFLDDLDFGVISVHAEVG